MKKIIFITILTLFLLPVVAFAAEGDLKPQTSCPVMGGEIDKNVYTDYQGQRIYFCCESCKKTFAENPEKYLDKIQKDKVLLESVQKKCPVMGGDIDKEVFIDYKGRRIYFCCAGCEEKFMKDPEKYLNKLK
ncbi:YHS domain-containing protein [Thermodesulfobacteriota bacterium]